MEPRKLEGAEICEFCPDMQREAEWIIRCTECHDHFICAACKEEELLGNDYYCPILF